MGVMVEPISGTVISPSALWMASRRALSGVAMQRDVFHHHDGVVDHQTDRGRQSAERHQVEALVEQLERDERDEYGRGNHQHGDDRGAPVAQKQHHDERGENDADQDGIAHAVDGIDHQTRLVVERLEVDSGRQRLRMRSTSA